ncbi:Cell division protein ZapA [Commensalibacter communis]|uniref:Cell division protein ZapA n=1 Tax=Commensalibacter communis TaxID=2972786 RepID=A0A9W4TPR5_9PROT|nr:cell division protein ZapA [Commensalibacter communis]CAI3924056.1 Cell division protein ZapA [Commensalibacter communis]CAI3924094.1 Cell division protein ZapA [Commensalibacter communis]CAI3929280.1 Cell division protein ZapA [Commensalibacter communis]CAI3930586.1 Cell division protein ZapA [Commensalibacter communis]CAI3930794.1 Cell division protein ZapA [Commensalibacter communis]
MAQVTITINGYGYTVGCNDGEEPHLQAMAKVVEQHIDLIRQIGGQSGEGRILALSSLLMADKLHDMEKYVASLEKQLDKQKLKQLQKENQELRKKLDDFAERAESIAEKLNLS